MKKALLASVISMLISQNAYATGPVPLFHLPAQDAERALDTMLKFDSRQDSAPARLKILKGESTDSPLAGMLSEPLKKILAAEEEKRLKETCNGEYLPDKQCGFNFNPVACSQAVSTQIYLYSSAQKSETPTLVSYQLQGMQGAAGTYRMIKNGNDWQIDGIDCGALGKFNMP